MFFRTKRKDQMTQDEYRSLEKDLERVSTQVFFFFIFLEPRVECYKRSSALNTSPQDLERVSTQVFLSFITLEPRVE